MTCERCLEEIAKMSTPKPAAPKISYLWFGGKDGWQVTSFHPSEDTAIGWPRGGYVQMFVNHSAYAALERENAELKREVEEQCRLNGIGQERELKLMAERDQLKLELQRMDDKLKAMAVERDGAGLDMVKLAKSLTRALEGAQNALRHSESLLTELLSEKQSEAKRMRNKDIEGP